MSKAMTAMVAGKGAAAARTSWAVEDVVLLAMMPYGLAAAVLLLCGPVMLVAWAVSEVIGRGR